MTNDELKDIGTKDLVLFKRDDKMMTKVKQPIETSDIDGEFMREYDDMHNQWNIDRLMITTKPGDIYKAP